MNEPSIATHYAAVRALAAALRLWRKGNLDEVTRIVENMPVNEYVCASLTLNEAAFATLAGQTGMDFDLLVEGVCAEMIGLESGDDEQG